MCPDWEKCDQFKCHNEQVCLNAQYWAKYWQHKGKTESVTKKEPILKNVAGHCYYCERQFGYQKVGLNAKPLIKTRDHIIPSSKGGINNPKNYVDCCERCNKLKNDLLPEDFANHIGYLMEHGCHVSKNTLLTILYNTRQLIIKIAPYYKELFIQSPITTQDEPEDKKWPEPEKEEKFDWSLSFREMERKYNLSPVKTKKVKIGRYREPALDLKPINPIIQKIADSVKKQNEPTFEKFNAMLKKKYLHIHTIIEQANPDLLRWLYDNILTKKEWTH